MKTINQVTLLGTLGRDAEHIKHPTGTRTTFSLCTTERHKLDNGEWEERATFHRCFIWNAGRITEHLKKGNVLYIWGKLVSRPWMDRGEQRLIHEVKATNIMLCSRIIQWEPNPEPGIEGPELPDEEKPF